MTIMEAILLQLALKIADGDAVSLPGPVLMVLASHGLRLG